MGLKGALTVDGGLRRGAAADLRELSLAGNVIGVESIRAFEQTTRSRPLLRITATRGEPPPPFAHIIAAVLLLPAMTLLFVCREIYVRNMGHYDQRPSTLPPQVFSGLRGSEGVGARGPALQRGWWSQGVDSKTFKVTSEEATAEDAKMLDEVEVTGDGMSAGLGVDNQGRNESSKRRERVAKVTGQAS
jgi:hypothetical protein